MRTAKGRWGFTLVEIMVVAVCAVLLMGPILQILRSGTRSSLQGMMQIDTTLEARRVIRQIHNDLKGACFPTTDATLRVGFQDVLRESGSAPLLSFSFLSFPIHGGIGEAVPDPGSGKAPRLASRITYRLERNPDPKEPFLQLFRDERFHPDHPLSRKHPGGVLSHPMSKRVNFLDIRPYEIQTRTRTQYYFWVTLQLVDTHGRVDRAGLTGGTRIEDRAAGLVVADFFDVVYPEFFHAFWNQDGINRNWYPVTAGPGM